MSPAALGFAVWALLAWHGGLHPWQAALAAALLGWMLWRWRADLPLWRDLGAWERLLWILVLGCAVGAAVSLRPQATLNTCAGLALALASGTLLRRAAPRMERGLSTLLLAAGALFSAAFLAAAFAAPILLGQGGGPDALLAARWLAPNQNLLAGGLALPALLLGSARLDADDGRGSSLAGWTAAVLAGLALVVAGSRGAYVALACGAAWLVLRRGLRGPQGRRIAGGSLLIVAAVAVLAVAAPFSRLAQRLRAQDDPAAEDVNFGRRLDFWSGAARLSLDQPLLGKGLGSFQAAAAGLDLPTPLTPAAPIARYRLTLEHAHNDWLELAVEAGWPLTLAALLCAGAWLRRRLREDAAQPGRLGLEAVVVAAFALSLVDMNMRTPGLAWGLVLCFAALDAPPVTAPGAGGHPQGAAPAHRAAIRAQTALAVLLPLLALWCACGSLLARDFLLRQHAGTGGSVEALAAVFGQPLNADLAAAAEDTGCPPPPWSAWAGRRDAAWAWHEAARADAAGDRAAQESAARRAIGLRPWFAPGYFWLAVKLDSWGRTPDAVELMDRALQLEPNFSRALAWEADLAVRQGKTALAKDLEARIRMVQGLSMAEGKPDPYTAYIQGVDPAWLAAHP